jgi:rhodanese-related sulfurtransferase
LEQFGENRVNLLSSFFGEQVPTIKAHELQQELQNGKQPFILDVRQPEEFRMGHIAGAKLIPLGQLERRIQEVPRDREIVCICASGHRSVAAVHILKTAGVTASSMHNGMIAWQMAKLPVNKGL